MELFGYCILMLVDILGNDYEIKQLTMYLGVIDHAEYESDMHFGHSSKVKVIN